MGEKEKKKKQQIVFMVLSPTKESGFHVIFGGLINLNKEYQDFFYM